MTLAQLDIVRPGFGLVTFPAQDMGGVVLKVKQGSHWAAETEAGDFIGTGPTKEAAVGVLAARLGIGGEITIETEIEDETP